MSLHRYPALLIALGATFSFCTAQAQSTNTMVEQENRGNGTTPLKPIETPTLPYPEEALRKGVEGTVTVTFVVDANGHVSDAKAISGPPELFEAAVESVKQWRFQPPINAPVSSTTTINYGHPHLCPAATADAGYVIVSSPLRSDRGTVVDFIEHTVAPMPLYLLKERLAGVSGQMVLAITVNARGYVVGAHVVKPLSPSLDKAAIKAIRKWRFKLRDGDPNSLPDVFLLRINYSGLCDAPLT